MLPQTSSYVNPFAGAESNGEGMGIIAGNSSQDAANADIDEFVTVVGNIYE